MTALGPEALARIQIDAQLEASGWVVQDRAEADLSAARGVATREVPLEKGHGRTDYLLFLDGKAVGAFEAKKAGTTLTGIEIQGDKYCAWSTGEKEDQPVRTRSLFAHVLRATRENYPD